MVSPGQPEATPEVKPKVLLNELSPFQRVIVVEEAGMRVLRFDALSGNDQSSFDPLHPDRVVFEYVRLAGLAVRLVKQPRRALVVGLGGGAFPRLLLGCDARLQVDVVELDPVVVDAARRFFDLPTSPRLQVYEGDGVSFLARVRAGYDIVLLAAFSGDGIPPSLTSKAFFHDARRALADGGVAVLNIALVSPAEMALIIERFADAFRGCVVVTGKAEENRILFGSRVPVSVDEVRLAAQRPTPALGYDAQADVDDVRPCP